MVVYAFVRCVRCGKVLQDAKPTPELVDQLVNQGTDDRMTLLIVTCHNRRCRTVNYVTLREIKVRAA